MRCKDCDAHMDEMLSGILHPDAIQHMRQCERCTSHYRARVTVQNGLRKLASASARGPAAVTDRAVMESYRRLQLRRAATWVSKTASESASEAKTEPASPFIASTARLLTFPRPNLSSGLSSRTWWTGAAAAAVVFAVFGSAVHLWNGVPSVNAPTVATAPSATALRQNAPADASRSPVVTANAASRPSSPRLTVQRPAQLSSQSHASPSEASRSDRSQPEVATAASRSFPPVLTAKSVPARSSSTYGEASNYDSAPVTQLPASARSVVRLASSEAASNVAQSASSTWPGYSNLMYCDPVVCSGPMQVVHIKVPVGQVRPNLGQTMGNAFVNAEVVIGPDGVARAIRVAN